MSVKTLRITPTSWLAAALALTACGGATPDHDATPEAAGEPAPSLAVNRAELDPLLEASDTAAVEELLTRGMDPVFGLVRAARVGATDMVSFLLDHGADPNGALADGFNSTALMAGASGNHPAVVSILVEAGADLNQPDVLGDPALNWAAYMGQLEYAEALVAAGARADIRTSHGNALEIALRQGWEPLIGLLGGSPEEVGIPALAVAAGAGDLAAVRGLLAEGTPVDATDPIGFTPLTYAARAGAADIVRVLAEAGAEVNHQSRPEGMGMTPLHMAAAKGQTEAVVTLLELGAEINAANAIGQGALVWAITEGHPETAVVMVEAGADPDMVGEMEYSGRQAATDYGFTEVLDAIEREGR